MKSKTQLETAIRYLCTDERSYKRFRNSDMTIGGKLTARGCWSVLVMLMRSNWFPEPDMGTDPELFSWKLDWIGVDPPKHPIIASADSLSGALELALIALPVNES